MSIVGLFLYALGAAAGASTILLPTHDVERDRATTAAHAPALVEVGTVLLSPKDTYLQSNKKNYSTSATLTAYTWPDYKIANAILMKFDLSSLPPDAIVTSATLQLSLVASDTSTDSTYTVAAHKVISKNPNVLKATGYSADGVNAWTANNCCQGVPLAQSDISPAYASAAINKVAGLKTWTVTTMVQEWLANPASNLGVVLNADASKRRDRYRTFASMEHTNVSLRPSLKVTFAAADVTPPVVAITAPLAGDISGTVPLTATAIDNVAVASVQFKVNGTEAGPESTSYPYVFNWDTTTRSDGASTITAEARDTTGNATTSAPVIVNVNNGLLVLSPQDTTLSINTTNYSADPMLMTYTWPDQRAANAIVMKFDLSPLPPGVVVQDAQLLLALLQSDPAVADTYSMSANKVVGRNPVIALATGYLADSVTPWSPSVCCNDGVPLAQSDISPPYATVAVDATPGFKAWTITSMVQEWLADPSTNFGVLLNSDASTVHDRYRYFASMENPVAATRPMLRLTYSMSGDTTPPVVAGVTVSGLAASVVTITWTTDESADSQVEYGRTVSYGSVSPFDGAAVTGHSVTLSGLSDGADYHFRVRSRDQSGNVTTSGDFVFTTLDVTAPAVALTAPASGATVSGTIAVTANASDNLGVAGVQFTLDGANLGAEDTTAPYSVSLNTTTLADGSHTVTAVARDASGLTTTASPVTVTVANVAPPPPLLWPHEPSGFTAIEETGWESGNLGAWYRIHQSGDKPINVGPIINSIIGEAQTLQLDYPAGHTGGGGTELRYDIAPADRRNEIYVGFYVQVNPQWQGHDSAINKMIYLHDGGSGFAAMWYEMFGSDSNPLGLYVVNQSGSGPAGMHENVNAVTFTRGQWHHVEIYQKQGASQNGIVRVWVNGVLAIDRSDVGTQSVPVDNVTISGIWGGIGDRKNQADYMRFDRIRISVK